MRNLTIADVTTDALEALAIGIDDYTAFTDPELPQYRAKIHTSEPGDPENSMRVLYQPIGRDVLSGMYRITVVAELISDGA